MPRTRADIHRDAMLRHLGAAYYEPLHGRATRSDVARAMETIEEHLHEEAQRGASGESASAQRGQQEHATGQHPIGPDATVPAAARLMSTHHVRRLPVVDPDGQHADLIPVAIRLMWDVDGVVDIVDRLGEARPSSTADQA